MAKESAKNWLDAVKGAMDIAAFITGGLSKANAPSESGGNATDTPYYITPVFGNYSTKNKEFATELTRILDVVHDYATRKQVGRPLNILLAAAPGTGKSFLAKEIAKALGQRLESPISGNVTVYFEEVHVAAFRSVDDLLGMFQTVQSANLKGHLPFILFDEVDGEVNGQYLLANFLAPMWDGKFHVGKESYALGRAIFCFAASSLVPAPTVDIVLGRRKQPSKNESLTLYSDFVAKWQKVVYKDISKVSKGTKSIAKRKDFLDRIDMMICIPPVDERLLGQEDTLIEYVDLACLLVLKIFPRVKKIEMAALAVIAKKLTGVGSRREAERCVFSSTTPPEENFSFSDLPEPDRKKFGKDQKVSSGLGKYFKIIKKKAPIST